MISDSPSNEVLPPFGRFQLLEQLGSGGMATVYRAEMRGEEGFSTLVALKVFHPHLAAQPEFVESFIKEARLGGLLSHPNLVATLDFGRQEGRPFMAMEFIDGASLERILDRYREVGATVPLEMALQVMIQVCQGVAYAHQATSRSGEPLRLVHRDLKPANILLNVYGQVKVADFGVARASVDVGKQTDAGLVKGTLHYMSPEQIAGDPLDHRSDLFALGLILYEFLTLETIYDAPSRQELMIKVLKAEVQPRLDAIGDMPERRALIQVLQNALAPERNRRYNSASELGNALRSILERLPRPDSLELWLAALLPELGHASSALPSGGETAPSMASVSRQDAVQLGVDAGDSGVRNTRPMKKVGPGDQNPVTWSSTPAAGGPVTWSATEMGLIPPHHASNARTEAYSSPPATEESLSRPQLPEGFSVSAGVAVPRVEPTSVMPHLPPPEQPSPTPQVPSPSPAPTPGTSSAAHPLVYVLGTAVVVLALVLVLQRGSPTPAPTSPGGGDTGPSSIQTGAGEPASPGLAPVAPPPPPVQLTQAAKPVSDTASQTGGSPATHTEATPVAIAVAAPVDIGRPAPGGGERSGTAGIVEAVAGGSRPTASDPTEVRPRRPRAEDGGPLAAGKAATARIESNPTATVFLDGKKLGSTPLSVPVEVGTRRLRFVNEELGIDFEVTRDVKPEMAGRRLKPWAYDLPVFGK